MPLWLWVLGCAGFVYVLTQGVITRRIRRVYPPLLCCPMCTGVWAGAACGLLYKLEPTLPPAVQWIVHVGLIAFAVSLAACVATVSLLTIGSHRKPDAHRDPAEPCSHDPARSETETSQGAAHP